MRKCHQTLNAICHVTGTDTKIMIDIEIKRQAL